jgi:hypothetical protein
MDMREASAMTEASGLTKDSDGIEQPGTTLGTAQAMKGKLGAHSRPAAAGLSENLQRMTLEAPLQSLLVAFLVGVIVARRH